MADDTNLEDSEAENLEGPIGNIYVMVPSIGGKYYIVMNGLNLSEATFDIER